MGETSGGTGRGGKWIDWPRDEVTLINNAMSRAHESFDRAYFRSSSVRELRRQVRFTIAALQKVLTVLDDHEAAELSS